MASKEMRDIIINETIIEPGKDQNVRIPVGTLPSGNKISVRAHIYRSDQEGPCILVLGGVHGDEINGVETVRRAIASRIFKKIKKGSVIAIPLLNIFGFINFSRDVPDGKDVNRSFPGSPNGSLAARVANVLMKQILPFVDFGIDFHTGGRSLHNHPQVRYTKGHPEAKELAEVFAAPFTIERNAIEKSLRKVAKELEKPILVFEGGESLRYDGLSIQVGLEGLTRLLESKGMLTTKTPARKSIPIGKTTWVRAPMAGTFLWYKASGNNVLKDEPLGEINDPQGYKTTTILAPQNGYIIGHNNAPVISQGDALFHIGN